MNRLSSLSFSPSFFFFPFTLPDCFPPFSARGSDGNSPRLFSGSRSPDEAVSSVMDDVLITVSSTLDRWRRGEEENRETLRDLWPPVYQENPPPPPLQCFSPIYLSDTNRVLFIASKCLGTSKGAARQTEKKRKTQIGSVKEKENPFRDQNKKRKTPHMKETRGC